MISVYLLLDCIKVENVEPFLNIIAIRVCSANIFTIYWAFCLIFITFAVKIILYGKIIWSFIIMPF